METTMTNKERTELAKLNAVVRSIDRVTAYGESIQELSQEGLDALSYLRDIVHHKRLSIVQHRDNHRDLNKMTDTEAVAYWNILQSQTRAGIKTPHLPLMDAILTKRNIAHQRGKRTVLSSSIK